MTNVDIKSYCFIQSGIPYRAAEDTLTFRPVYGERQRIAPRRSGSPTNAPSFLAGRCECRSKVTTLPIYYGQFRLDACKSASDRPFPGFFRPRFQLKNKRSANRFFRNCRDSNPYAPPKAKGALFDWTFFQKGRLFCFSENLATAWQGPAGKEGAFI